MTQEEATTAAIQTAQDMTTTKGFRLTAGAKRMMDCYNQYYAPEINGRKKVESINCMPCVRKVMTYFLKLQPMANDIIFHSGD